jgi:hypothetical protein
VPQPEPSSWEQQVESLVRRLVHDCGKEATVVAQERLDDLSIDLVVGARRRAPARE